MAKRKNDTSGNDYLDQLHWQAQRSSRRWLPSRFEPKWKYKIVYRSHDTTLAGRIIQTALFIGVIFLIVYLISSGIFGESLAGKIFLSVVFGLIITIIFFAIRDGSKDDDDDKKADS